MTPLDLDVSVAGLPLHPLVVHLAVVALPVGAAALIASVLSRWFRTRYGTASVLVLTVGALAGLLAKESGEALAETEKLPPVHATFGSATAVVGIVAMLLGWAWWWLDRRSARAATTRHDTTSDAPGSRAAAPAPSGAARIAGLLASLAALATMGLTVAAGHTGATAVWGSDTTEQDARPSSATASPATVPGGTPGGAPAAASTTPAASASATGTPAASTAPSGYRLADVARHKDATSCWAAINGGVYDLTAWVGKHPGGAQRILGICGTDASKAFTGQHAGERRPATELARYRIGDLVAG